MNKLWIGFAVVVTYGSIYPFNFQIHTLDADTYDRFIASCCLAFRPGDILGNIILFVPYGFLGMLAPISGRALGTRLCVVLVTGFVVALGVQIAQIYLPTRDENLQDVFWNMLGILVGILPALLAGKQMAGGGLRPLGIAMVPGLLIGSWLAYRLFPFVPSIDFQAIKDSLKPLLLDPQINPVGIFHDAVAWLIVATLLPRLLPGKRLDLFLPVLIVGVFGLEVLIVQNSLSATNVAGGVLALALWFGLLKHVGWRDAVLALLLCVMLLVDGLAPFTLAPDTAAFNWLPFKGLLGGSMYLNVQSISEKVFLYGSLVYVLWQTRLGQISGIVIATAIVALIEFCQMFFADHTPEITDPILVVLAAWTLIALRDQETPAQQAASAQRPTDPGPDEKRSFVKSSAAKAPQEAIPAAAVTAAPPPPITFPREEADFLKDLSAQMSASVSEVCQRIVDQFIQEAPRTGIGMLKPVRMGKRAVTIALDLRPDQIDWIRSISRDRGLEETDTVRAIIHRFMRDL